MSFRAGIIVLIFGTILALGVGPRSCAKKDDASLGERVSTREGDRDPTTSHRSDEVEAKASKLPRLMPEESAKSFIRAKLKSIIIPVIAFDDTSIEEAIDFLRARSIELDREEADTSRKGVSFHIGKPLGDTGAVSVNPVRLPEDEGAIRLTMDARNISLWEILHRIAREAGLKVEITDRGIELHPR